MKWAAGAAAAALAAAAGVRAALSGWLGEAWAEWAALVVAAGALAGAAAWQGSRSRRASQAGGRAGEPAAEQPKRASA